jgi:two-component SAPR family response regulator
VRLAEAANQLTAHSQAALLNDLAAAYAESGRFEDAVATERRAMRLVSNSSHKELAQQIQNCLELYEERKPYHRGQ